MTVEDGAERMSVVMIIRSDGRTKAGGDVVQAEAYARHLRADGAEVSLVPYTSAVAAAPGVVHHFFNIDRPFEFLSFASRSPRGSYCVSPIHHARADVRRMRRSERARSVHGVAALLPEALRDLLAFQLRCIRIEHGPLRRRVAEAVRAALRLPALRRRVRRALDDAGVVFLLADSERDALRTDFGWDGGNGVMAPNGVERSASPMPSWPQRALRILVVGRIEPRKRQLAVLEAADALGVPITFVGAANTNSSGYAAEFTRASAASRTCEWLGALPHDEVLELMRSSRVLLNFSWVEVQSLVDIEAVENGCWVVASRAGSADTALQGAVRTFDADGLSDALSMAVGLADGVEGPPAGGYPRSWKQATRAVLDGYRGMG